MRKTRRKNISKADPREQQEQAELEEFFLKKFSYLKQKSIEYLENYSELIFRPEDSIKNVLTHQYMSINSNSYSQNIKNNTIPEKLVYQAFWLFNNIFSREQYFRMQDAINSYLMQNEYIYEAQIQMQGSQLYGYLLVLESIPFIKRIEKLKLSLENSPLLAKRIEENKILKCAVGEALELISKMILIRKSIISIEIYQAVGYTAESVSIGIGKCKITSSHQLTRFCANNLFSEIQSKNVQQVLNSLSSFNALNYVEFGEVNLDEDESVLQLNKVIQKVDTLHIKFKSQDLSSQRNIPLEFGQKYEELSINYSINELKDPNKLDLFFQKLLNIKNVNKLKLQNDAQLSDLPYSKASTIITKTSELRKILPGSFILEKLQTKEQAEMQCSKNEYQSISQFQYFERLINANKIKHLTLIGQITHRLCDSLLSLCRKGKVNFLEIQQQSYNLNHIFTVPYSIKTIYEQELNIDLKDIFQIAEKQEQFQFQLKLKQGNFNLFGCHLDISINQFLKDQIFDPFDFQIHRLNRLNITASELENLSLLEKICLTVSKIDSLTQINLKLSLCNALRKKITNNTLHKQSNLTFELPNVSFQYLKHLTQLSQLKNLILALDFDQTIIDSVEYLLKNSRSINTVILRRNNVQQFAFNFSKVIEALKLSKTINHALLAIEYVNIQIIHPPHKIIFEKQKLSTFYLPIASLLENPECQLISLEIQENEVFKEGVDSILCSKLKKLNQTVLQFYYHYLQKYNESNSLLNKALSQNLVKEMNSYQDDFKFMTSF